MSRGAPTGGPELPALVREAIAREQEAILRAGGWGAARAALDLERGESLARRLAGARRERYEAELPIYERRLEFLRRALLHGRSRAVAAALAQLARAFGDRFPEHAERRRYAPRELEAIEHAEERLAASDAEYGAALADAILDAVRAGEMTAAEALAAARAQREAAVDAGVAEALGELEAELAGRAAGGGAPRARGGLSTAPAPASSGPACRAARRRG